MKTRDDSIQESIGNRVASFRKAYGWTQQALADRLAISRVAVSHIEMDLTIPGERTVTILAGVFKLSPHELVEGTTYPMTKSERLPSITCCYTQLELDLAIIQNDLEWFNRLSTMPKGEVYKKRFRNEIIEKWGDYVSQFGQLFTDEREKEHLARIRQVLRKMVED